LTQNRGRLLSRIALALVLLAGILALYLSPARQWMTQAKMRDLVETLQNLWYGPLVFIALYAVGCVFFVPATLFILSAGVIWGWLSGGTYAVIGGLLGATASFFLARYLGGNLMHRFGRGGAAVARQLENAGFRTFLTFRLLPLFPFPVLNYAAGFAGLRFRDFFFATLIGTSPSHYIVAYFAAALMSGAMSQGEAFRKLALAGLLIAMMVLIPTFIRNRMRTTGTDR